MMVTCMNDPGPIPGPTGTMITDPLFNPSYSQFCYEIPFMPGQTQYMDTPVTPTSAFAGAGYNNVDCAYPDLTPAIKQVDGDGVGPWVSAPGHTIRITALGLQTVVNNAYSGPSYTTAPYNQKTITRNYGFGPAPAGGCSNGNPNAACPNVTIGGVPLHGVTWTDTLITGTTPPAGSVPACSIQQQAQYGGSAAQCGELVITRADNRKSTVDTVTVTIGGKAPTRLAAGQSIQSAIDAARPGDLIIVPPGTYHELLLMWKPVRLQGVGAASTIIDANTHPSGALLNDWRLRVVCLFGLAPTGVPDGYNPACGSGWSDFTPTAFNPQVDRLPLEATVGWDATLNGNLAEQLQEPTLMGAYEGAGITVLSKGVNFPSDPYDPTLLAGFPAGTTLLMGSQPESQGHGNFAVGEANANCHTDRKSVV